MRFHTRFAAVFALFVLSVLLAFLVAVFQSIGFSIADKMLKFGNHLLLYAQLNLIDASRCAAVTLLCVWFFLGGECRLATFVFCWLVLAFVVNFAPNLVRELVRSFNLLAKLD